MDKNLEMENKTKGLFTRGFKHAAEHKATADLNNWWQTEFCAEKKTPGSYDNYLYLDYRTVNRQNNNYSLPSEKTKCHALTIFWDL